jgi:hypothetical protein
MIEVAMLKRGGTSSTGISRTLTSELEVEDEGELNLTDPSVGFDELRALNGVDHTTLNRSILKRAAPYPSLHHLTVKANEPVHNDFTLQLRVRLKLLLIAILNGALATAHYANNIFLLTEITD